MYASVQGASRLQRLYADASNDTPNPESIPDLLAPNLGKPRPGLRHKRPPHLSCCATRNPGDTQSTVPPVCPPLHSPGLPWCHPHLLVSTASTPAQAPTALHGQPWEFHNHLHILHPGLISSVLHAMARVLLSKKNDHIILPLKI